MLDVRDREVGVDDDDLADTSRSYKLDIPPFFLMMIICDFSYTTLFFYAYAYGPFYSGAFFGIHVVVFW